MVKRHISFMRRLTLIADKKLIDLNETDIVPVDKGAINIYECGECRSLVAKEMIQWHSDWHGNVFRVYPDPLEAMFRHPSEGEPIPRNRDGDIE